MAAEPSAPLLLWAPLAWLPDGWRENVLLRAGADGRWAEVTADVAVAPAGARVLAGPLLPGVVDAHSHAFQRAFAGMAERRDAASDDFWSWRERMYAVALRIGPEQLRAIAAQLYVELLRGGYTHVCEFHYLRRDVDGSDYADPLAMSWALADAAADAGIGLTILPVLYERAGFAADRLRDDQRRFRSTPAEPSTLRGESAPPLGRSSTPASRSTRCVRASAASIAALATLADGDAGPIHIHVAEQTGEVDECLRATGRGRSNGSPRRCSIRAGSSSTRPTRGAGDRRGRGERRRCRRLPEHRGQPRRRRLDLPGWLAAGVPLAVGSDSQATRDWREELRLLEYGQRLARRARNVAAAPELGVASTAERLFARVLARLAGAAGDLRGASSPARAPTRWSSIAATTRCSASSRSARSTRSSSAARRRRGAT